MHIMWWGQYSSQTRLSTPDAMDSIVHTVHNPYVCLDACTVHTYVHSVH